MAVQRCTVHKHRNLLAHAPERLHEEISNDYRDMIYAATRGEVETRRKAFIRKWRLKSRAVADSLEEAGDKLFTFTRIACTSFLTAYDDGRVIAPCVQPTIALSDRIRHPNLWQVAGA